MHPGQTTIQTGDVFWARLPEASGHEQRGVRYVVAIQASELQLSTVIVAPTSTQALPTMFRPRVEIAGAQTQVLTEQIRAVDRRRLREPLGRLRWEEIDRIDGALELVLGLAR